MGALNTKKDKGNTNTASDNIDLELIAVEAIYSHVSTLTKQWSSPTRSLNFQKHVCVRGNPLPTPMRK